jgi:phage-related tail fiber protein
MMTAQRHIDAIGKAVTDLEDAAKDMRQVSKRVVLATKALHDALEKAEAAYIASVANDGNVVAFSGGTNKPPVDDPDKPVEP